MTTDYHRPGAPFPRCDSCSHEWHGEPCRRFDTQTPGRAGEPCGCPTAFRFKENAS